MNQELTEHVDQLEQDVWDAIFELVNAVHANEVSDAKEKISWALIELRNAEVSFANKNRGN